MTDHERVLHTVLAHCLRPLMKTEGADGHIEALETRIVEIRAIVEKIILQTALDKVS